MTNGSRDEAETSDFLPGDIDQMIEAAGGKFALALGLGRRARVIHDAERDATVYGATYSGMANRPDRSSKEVTRAMQELAAGEIGRPGKTPPPSR